jgi:hypothetical protein
MTSKLLAITRTGPGQYQIKLEVPDTARRLTFDCTVVETEIGISVVERSEALAAYVDPYGKMAMPLMEAILQFHRAQKVDYP